MEDLDDLYEILQVHPSAHPDVIQAAYRRLSLLYHSDRNKSPEAAGMTVRLNRAHEILSDRDWRAAYDRAQTSSRPQHREHATYTRHTWSGERRSRDTSPCERLREVLVRQAKVL